LRLVARRYPQCPAQTGFIGVDGKIDAVDRTDVHASVAFDAQRRREYRLHIAVETPFGFPERELVVEAQFDFDLQVA
jgi:hypothetical protein